MRNYKRMWKIQRDMRKHYESLYHAGTGELKFNLLQIDYLYNVLDEIESMTTDALAK